jgi:hypothetical protein
LDRAGRPFLGDFGIARSVTAATVLTATGGFMGSVSYAAPEQVLGEPATGASDLYALTAVLYQCMCGQVPYPRPTDAAVIYAHIHDPPPSLPSTSREADALSRLIERGMAKEPDHRYRLAAELMDDVTRVLASMSPDRRSAAPPFATGVSPTRPTFEARPNELAGASPAPATERNVLPPAQSPPSRDPSDTRRYASPDAARAQSPRRDVRSMSEPTTADRRRESPLPAADPRRRGRRALAVGAVVGALVVAAAIGAAMMLKGGSSPTRRVAVTIGATSGSTGRAGATSASGRTGGHRSTGASGSTGATVTTSSTSATQGSQSRYPPPAVLEIARPPAGGYTILVPSNWSYRALGATGGLWVGANPLEKMVVVRSDCAVCASNANSPDPAAVGLPAGTVSSVQLNPLSIGYQAYTSGDPYPDNGLVVVTLQDGSPSGYAQVDLWLPAPLHSLAARILNSFSPFQDSLTAVATQSGSTSTATTTSTSSAATSSGASSSTQRQIGAPNGQTWPTGFAGYTVALASTVTYAGAVDAFRRATAHGLPEVGVLRSSDYSSLNPGCWFVFSGAYSKAASAARGVSAARAAGFSDAYVRFVAR